MAAPAAYKRRSSRHEWTIGLVAGTAGVVLTMLVLVAFGELGSRSPTTFFPDSVITTPSGVMDPLLTNRLATAVRPSIVTIRTGSPDIPSISGIAVSHEQVLTAAHVLVGTSFTILTADGATWSASIVGTDPSNDVALLRLDGANLRPAALGSSDALRIGEAVIGVAAGRGQDFYASAGVLSARNALVRNGSSLTMAGLLETDVKTTAEHIGGVLLDTSGMVVGMLDSAPGDPQTGLSVPVTVLQDSMDQLRTIGKALHGWLGAEAVDAADRPSGGVTVAAVAQPGPAASGAIATGDVITAVAGHTIGGVGDLIAEVRLRKPGDSLDLTVWTGAKSRKVTVKLEAQPTTGPAASPQYG